MAGTKAFRTIAEALDSTKKVVRGVDVRKLDPTTGSGTLGALTRDLDEYNKVAGELDKANQVPTSPREVQVEIARREAVVAEDERLVGISSSSAEPSIRHQANGPEEFKIRLENQLRDPQYAAESVFTMPPSIAQGEAIVQKSQELHKTTVDQVLGKLRTNDRWSARTDEWFGDSPYKNDLQFHTDRQTDPLRPNSFIQFEQPKELGLHSGTNSAAETVISVTGIEDVLRNMDEQQAALKQIADELGFTVEAVEVEFGKATRKHFLNHFRSKGVAADPNVWDNTEMILDFFLEQISADNAQVKKFIQGMKDLPTPSTTPFLFRGKNGLLLQDITAWTPDSVGQQLLDIFPAVDDQAAIAAAIGQQGRQAKTKALTDFIESKGFDHVIYHNAVEDKGSLSIINWNEDLMASPWHPDFTRDNAEIASKVVSSYMLAALGLGGASATIREQK